MSIRLQHFHSTFIDLPCILPFVGRQQVIGQHIDEFAVRRFPANRAAGDLGNALLVRFPAKVDHRADVMLDIHGGCLVLHGKIRINVFRDSNGLVRRIHRKLDCICQIKVAFVVGSNSKFSDGSID